LARELELSQRLFNLLPAFPEASMGDVLAVRGELSPHLRRFRAAVRGMADSLQAEADVDEGDVVELYRQKVSPALEELAAKLEDLGVRESLMRVASSKELAATSSLSLATAAGVGMADLAAAFMGLPIGPAIAAVATEARARRTIRQEAAANPFYFLYRAEEELGKWTG
jgi:hypothetical protein